MQADMVVYGKTVAGGMPIGVVCGRKRADAPLRSRAADARRLRGRHVLGPPGRDGRDERVPAVAGRTPSTAPLYAEMNQRCSRLGARDQRAPGRARRCRCAWCTSGRSGRCMFTEPGRYNWLLQYYLRAQGVTLTWVGTGRCLSNMDFTAKDYEELQTKLVRGRRDHEGRRLVAERRRSYPGRDKIMRRRLTREVLGHLIQVPRPSGASTRRSCGASTTTTTRRTAIS